MGGANTLLGPEGSDPVLFWVRALGHGCGGCVWPGGVWGVVLLVAGITWLGLYPRLGPWCLLPCVGVGDRGFGCVWWLWSGGGWLLVENCTVDASICIFVAFLLSF